MLLKENKLNIRPTGGMSSFLLFHLVYFFSIIYIKRIKNGYYTQIYESEGKINLLNNNNIYHNSQEKKENSYEDNNNIILDDKKSLLMK